jgi:hypothetical protein
VDDETLSWDQHPLLSLQLLTEAVAKTTALPLMRLQPAGKLPDHPRYEDQKHRLQTTYDMLDAALQQLRHHVPLMAIPTDYHHEDVWLTSWSRRSHADDP